MKAVMQPDFGAKRYSACAFTIVGQAETVTSLITARLIKLGKYHNFVFRIANSFQLKP